MSRKAWKFKAISAQNCVISKKKKKRSSPKFRVIFRPNSEIQRFFRPNSGDLQKKNKKKQKRSSPKLRLIFRPISQIQTFEGGCFRMGGAIFHFTHKIRLNSTKNMQFCTLYKPMGGLEPLSPPPPPGYATAGMLLSGHKSSQCTGIFVVLSSNSTWYYFNSSFIQYHVHTAHPASHEHL